MKLTVKNKEVIKKIQNMLKKVKDDDIDKSISQTAYRIIGLIQQRKLTGQVLNVRSGQLRGSFRVEKDKKNTYNVVNSKVYAKIHEFGGEIVPLRGTKLRFIGEGGKEIFLSKVVIPERSYVRTAVKDYWAEIMKDFANYLWEKIK